MKINFADIKFRPSLFEVAAPIKDFNKQLANSIWQQKDIAAGKFALRLFDNPEIEVSKEEVGFIKEALGGFVQWVGVAVLEALGEEEG